MEERELLFKLREFYLYDTDVEGQPKAPISEVIELWDKVNKCLNK